MKFMFPLKAGLLSLAVSTVLLAQEVKLNLPADAAAKTPATLAAAPAPTFTDAELLETFGWFVMARIGIADLQFTPGQIEAFARGVSLAAAGKEPPHDLRAVGPAMDAFIGQRQEAALERSKQRNLAAAVTFFNSLKNRPGIVSLPDGLCYEILKPGTGPNVKATDSVTINYTGMLLNGQVFDSSEQQGQPLTIALSEAIPGWAEGMQKINKGGKIKLYIPPSLAFGDEGAGGIPPASSVIFEIEVLEIMPTPATPAAK
ncbi:MAG: FKBP-type peptidyl-prolyl cis-trans isomerase [Cephaloticoccus sp.]|nr:FKBP-type peptidyl-prolyl cis-trans isomerase [Cephaloticoccus sp.]MCF7761103.1 FKBP-type peptidyl-prolyl cis-trans isomerase [Cephaloticoccus sp.]